MNNLLRGVRRMDRSAHPSINPKVNTLLMTTWRLLGDHLVSTWWPLGDYLVTTFSFKFVSFENSHNGYFLWQMYWYLFLYLFADFKMRPVGHKWKYVRCNLLLIFFCDGCSRGPGTTALLELDAVDHTIVDHTLIDHTLDDHTVVDHILVDHTDICTFQTCQMQLLSHVWIFFRAGRPIKTVVWYGCL